MNLINIWYARVVVLSLVLSVSLASSVFGRPQVSTENPQLEGSEQVRVFRLKHGDVDVILSVLKSVYGESMATSGTRLAVDANTNSLIAASRVDTLRKIEELIQQLDMPGDQSIEAPTEPVNLVVQLIIDSAEEHGPIPLTTPVTGRIETMLIEASDNGLIRRMKTPHIVSQSLIRVTPGLPNVSAGKVATGGSAVEGVIRLNLDGMLYAQKGDSFQLSTKIEIITQPLKGSSTEENRRLSSAQIQTETTLIRNHPVLLSVNTIEGRSYLILVEVR